MPLETQLPPSLSDLLTQDAMRNAQLRQIGQEGQLRNLQMGQMQQDIAQKARLRDLLSNLPEGQDPTALIPNLVRMGPEGMQMAGQIQGLYAKDNKPIVVGRSLMSPKGEILGTDVTWAEEQKANREAKMAELQARLQESGLARADRMALQREMFNLRKEQIQQGNRPPPGYRYTPEGNLEAIPGGPAATGKALPGPAIEKLSGAGTAVEDTSRLAGTFKPEYGGKTILGDMSNTYKRIMGDETGQAQWWQDMDALQNQTRHNLFGSALTSTELKAWEKTSITPRMNPDQIKANLARRQEIEARAASKLARAYTAAGYNQNQINELLGTASEYVTKPAPPVGTVTHPKYPGFSIAR